MKLNIHPVQLKPSTVRTLILIDKYLQFEISIHDYDYLQSRLLSRNDQTIIQIILFFYLFIFMHEQIVIWRKWI
jgi:hypothetical protein